MRQATLADPPRFELVEQVRGRITLAADTGEVAHLFVPEDDIMRLLLIRGGQITSPPSWAIAPGMEDIADPGRDRMSMEGFLSPPYRVAIAEGSATVATDRLRVTIGLHGLHCHWEQRAGDGWRTMQRDRATQAYDFGWWDGRVHHYVAAAPGERLHGLGEKAGPLDRAGRRFRMLALDAMGYDAETTDPLYKPINYLLVAQADGACHGCFYDTVAEAAFDLGAELDNYHGPYRHFVAEAGDLDLWMIAGPTPAAVTRRFTWLTGRPAATPDWALSYSGSTMSYTDAPDAEAQLCGFLDRLDETGIPCASFHLSSGYTSIDDRRYVFHWNCGKFPDPARFARRFSDRGVRLVANVKPTLLCDHPLFAEAAARGFLACGPDGAPSVCQFWDGLGACVDFTNHDAAAWWREQIKAALLEVGIAATWNDNNEFEVWDTRATIAGFGRPLPAAHARLLQPLLMTRASRRAQIEHDPQSIPYVITRSGSAGLHRYAQTWTGDNRTSWATLKWNIRMGLGLALSGVSNLGHDIGGFSGPPPDPELLVRWVQAGMFLPRFSMHSWNDDGSTTEPWMYPDTLPVIRRLMQLRERLVPFLAALLADYRDRYEPVLRPLWYDAPDDPRCWQDRDAHLAGRDLLLMPVVVPGATSASSYLPSGSAWIDPLTGDRHPGGTEATLAAPLGGPPVFLVRSGSRHLNVMREALGAWHMAEAAAS